MKYKNKVKLAAAYQLLTPYLPSPISYSTTYFILGTLPTSQPTCPSCPPHQPTYPSYLPSCMHPIHLTTHWFHLLPSHLHLIHTNLNYQRMVLTIPTLLNDWTSYPCFREHFNDFNLNNRQKMFTIFTQSHIFLPTLLTDLLYTYLLYPCTLPKSRGKLIIQ